MSLAKPSKLRDTTVTLSHYIVTADTADEAEDIALAKSQTEEPESEETESWDTEVTKVVQVDDGEHDETR
jgi:hypothetical protein